MRFHIAKVDAEFCFIGQVTVGHHPKLALWFECCCGGANERAAKVRVTGPTGMKRGVHDHRIERLGRLPARGIGPVKRGTRVGDIGSRAVQCGFLGLYKMKACDGVPLKRFGAEIPPARAQVGQHCPEFLR